ncbi:MAG: BamA/TamA family outer membrane protein [Bacteroidota bacterium]|nr:BamA/TamA family outer membrane protein [Bacteroidota bacterium]
MSISRGLRFALSVPPFVLVCALLFPIHTTAQFLPFGRNKVQYTDFDWRILRTEHFNIYYYPEMEELAGKGARFAEESFRKLERDFNFTVTHRIPLIFYSSPLHFQQTNVTPGFIPDGVGGFFEFIKGRVVIPGSGSLENFRHVINHELVHVFMHNKLEWALRSNGQRSDRYLPLWFVEGLAEYYSTDWDAQAEMVLRDAVLSGYFAPLSRVYAISGSFLMYKEGQDALGFIAREFGREKIVQLIENFWVSEDFQEVFRFTLGVGYEEFDRRWLRDLRRRYYPLVATHDRPGDVGTRIVPYGYNAKPVYYRQGDSSYVIFAANATGYSGLYRTSLNGGETRLLLEGEKTDRLEAFHLLGSRMSVNAAGMLAFVTKSGESDVIHLYDLRRGELARTLVIDSLVMIASPSWNPDGSKLAFSGLNAAGENDLYVLDLASRDLVRLTHDLYDDRDPAWSPDGASIAFTSDRGPGGKHGRTQLFLYDIEAGGIRYLTQDSCSYASPSWSSDGSTIVATTDHDGTHNLCVMVLDSADPALPSLRGSERGELPAVRRVSRFLTAAFDPTWTTDGDILYSAFDGFSFQIQGLKAISARLDSLETIHAPRRVEPTEAWSVAGLSGASVSARVEYEKEYEVDIAQSAISTDPVFGTLGGAALSISDVLGDDRYYFLLYNTAQTSGELLSSFNVAVTRVSLAGSTPFSYGVFHVAGRRYDLLDPDLYFHERAFGGFFAAAYPLSKFTRIEGSFGLSNSDKEALTELRQRKALLLTNSVSYVSDNALYYWTGPIDGSRFNLTLSHTTDLRYANVNYYSVMLDYRRYFRIGLRSALATRYEFLYNHGKEARRYFLGGSWDLRGWPRWSIRGTKRWLTSHELRFPVLDRVGFDFPFGSITLGVLRGALFFDAGNSWDERYGETLGSIGAGLRFSLFGVFVLRYDIGKRIEDNFTRLQGDLFQQFFFGWDF